MFITATAAILSGASYLFAGLFATVASALVGTGVFIWTTRRHAKAANAFSLAEVKRREQTEQQVSQLTEENQRLSVLIARQTIQIQSYMRHVTDNFASEVALTADERARLIDTTTLFAQLLANVEFSLIPIVMALQERLYRITHVTHALESTHASLDATDKALTQLLSEQSGLHRQVEKQLVAGTTLLEGLPSSKAIALRHANLIAVCCLLKEKNQALVDKINELHAAHEATIQQLKQLQDGQKKERVGFQPMPSNNAAAAEKVSQNPPALKEQSMTFF